MSAQAPNKEIVRAIAQLRGTHKSCIAISAPGANGAALGAVMESFKGAGPGLFISTSRPYKDVAADLEKKGVSPSDIFFIDASGANKDGDRENCAVVEYNASLTALSIVITGALAESFGFCVLDSLDAMLVYNDEEKCRLFASYLVNKARNNSDVPLVIIAREGPDSKKLIQEVSEFCDTSVRIKKA